MSEEQYQKKKKKILLSMICTIAIVLGVGVSYAFWQKTKVQEDTNIVASGCFDIELSGKNAINLAETYPLSNEEGLHTLPFTFTIKNVCDYKAVYTINLESLTRTTFQSNSIKVALDDKYKLYSNYTITNKHFSDSKESRILASGVLPKEESKTYNLRLWIDENAPISEQNKIFESKIVINSEIANEQTTNESILKIGDYINMTPTSTSYTIPTEVTGYESEQEINPSELNLWRVIRKNEDGTVDVVSEYVSNTEVYFRGQIGYMNLVGGLNTIASQYTNANYVIKTRYMGFNNQTEYCTSLGECQVDADSDTDINLVSTAIGTLIGNDSSGAATPYWLSSRNMISSEYYGRYINSTGLLSTGVLVSQDGAEESLNIGIRPILTLKADIELVNGDGKSVDTAYTLE